MNNSNNEERTYKSKGMLYGIAVGSIIGAIITRLTAITALPICISVGLLLGLAIGSKIKRINLTKSNFKFSFVGKNNISSQSQTYRRRADEQSDKCGF